MSLPTLPSFFPIEYDTNWRHLAQQKTSALDGRVTIENFSGKEKRLNYMGSRTFRPITVRHGVTTPQDSTLDRRWLRKRPFDDVVILDEWDNEGLGAISMPNSGLMTEQASAWARLNDQVIITAGLGDAWSGEEGTTAVPLPAGQKVAVNYVATGSPANSGLTLAKLIRAAAIFGLNEVDPSEERILIHSQKQLDDLLLNVQQVSSADYNSVKALVDGKVNKFMGFTFVPSQRLPLNVSTDVRSCMAYVKTGLVLSRSDMMTHVDIRADRNHAVQIRAKGLVGSARVEDAKVVEILCDESP